MRQVFLTFINARPWPAKGRSNKGAVGYSGARDQGAVGRSGCKLSGERFVISSARACAPGCEGKLARAPCRKGPRREAQAEWEVGAAVAERWADMIAWEAMMEATRASSLCTQDRCRANTWIRITISGKLAAKCHNWGFPSVTLPISPRPSRSALKVACLSQLHREQGGRSPEHAAAYVLSWLRSAVPRRHAARGAARWERVLRRFRTRRDASWVSLLGWG